MTKTNPKVDTYIRRAKTWRDETEKLRKIVLSCGLTEELKWGKPCYAFRGSNVVIIQGFSKYIALLFFKGVLMKDPDGILEKTGVNTRVGRQIRFTSAGEIDKLKPKLKKYVLQAIEAEKAGLKVAPKKKTKLVLVEELQNEFVKNPALKTAFNALTPGRQRAYNFHFSAPKQSKTRVSRIEKSTPLILKGEGLNDWLAKRK
ncbi:MAG: DUF1801 domain-containing protein [Ilumatobacteraceae bacterium]